MNDRDERIVTYLYPPQDPDYESLLEYFEQCTEQLKNIGNENFIKSSVDNEGDIRLEYKSTN